MHRDDPSAYTEIAHRQTSEKTCFGTLLQFANSLRPETTANFTEVPFDVEDKHPSLDEDQISIRRHMLYLSGGSLLAFEVTFGSFDLQVIVTNRTMCNRVKIFLQKESGAFHHTMRTIITTAHQNTNSMLQDLQNHIRNAIP